MIDHSASLPWQAAVHFVRHGMQCWKGHRMSQSRVENMAVMFSKFLINSETSGEIGANNA